MPDLACLELLVAVDELGSLTRVATRLGVSQHAVSSRIRSLEGQIGAPLISRSPRGATLTETGVMITGWAADVLAAAERMEAGIESIRTQSLRQLDVAASLTIAEYLLPRWLVTLRSRQEAAGQMPTRIGLSAANSETVIARYPRPARTRGRTRSRGIHFRSLTQGIATTGPMGKAMLTIMSAFAQLERDQLAERTRVGLAAAASGRKGGWPGVTLDSEKERLAGQYRTAGLTPPEIGKLLGVSRATVYRYLGLMAAEATG